MRKHPIFGNKVILYHICSFLDGKCINALLETNKCCYKIISARIRYEFWLTPTYGPDQIFDYKSFDNIYDAVCYGLNEYKNYYNIFYYTINKVYIGSCTCKLEWDELTAELYEDYNVYAYVKTCQGTKLTYWQHICDLLKYDLVTSYELFKCVNRSKLGTLEINCRHSKNQKHFDLLPYIRKKHEDRQALSKSF